MPFGLGLSLQWRYRRQGQGRNAAGQCESLGGAFNFDPGLQIKAQNYFDLAATYTFGDHYQPARSA